MAMKSTIAALRNLPHPTTVKLAFAAAQEYYGLSKSQIVAKDRSKKPLFARWSIIETIDQSVGSFAVEVLSEALNRHRTTIICSINDYRNRTTLKPEWERDCLPGFNSILKRLVREHRDRTGKD